MSDRLSEESAKLSKVASTEGRTAATIALAMFLGFVAIVVLLHFLRPDMHPFQEFISDYAVGEYGFLMTTAYLAFALGIAALMVSLYQGLPLMPRSWASLVLLSACSVLVTLAGIFPTDLGGEIATTSGQIHNLASLLFFLLLMIAMLVLSIRLRRAGMLEGRYMALLWLSIAAPILLVATFIQWDGAGLVGLRQRLYVLTVISWLAIMANGVRSQAFMRVKEAQQ